MTGRTERDGLDERLHGVPLLGGLLAGIVSFAAGYLSFVGIAAGTGDGIEFNRASLGIVGRLFYNSFLVDRYERLSAVTEQQLEGAERAVEVEERREMWYNPFLGDEQEVREQLFLDGQLVEERAFSEPANGVALSFPEWVYLAVPVVVLLAVAVAFSYRFVGGGDLASGRDLGLRMLVGGGVITLGFLLVALLGTYALTLEGEGSVLRPDRVDALVYGSVYPAVCGTLGVALGQLLHRPDFDGTGRKEAPPEDADAPDGDGSDDGSEADDVDPDSGVSGADGADDGETGDSADENATEGR